MTAASAFPGLDGALASRRLDTSGGAERGVDLSVNFVDSGFFRVLQIPGVRGADLSVAPLRPATAAISVSAARRLFGDGNAVGRDVFIGRETNEPLTVAALVPDIVYYYNSGASTPVVYVSDAQYGMEMQRGAIAIVSAAQTNTLRSARTVLTDIDGRLPPTFPRSLADQVSSISAGRRSIAQLLGASAVVVVILSSLGVFAVVSQAEQRRRREMAIRIALGRDPRLAAVTFVTTGVRLAVAGAAIGALALIPVIRLLRARFSSFDIDILVVLSCCALFIAAALAASILPAVRTARVDLQQTMQPD